MTGCVSGSSVSRVLAALPLCHTGDRGLLVAAAATTCHTQEPLQLLVSLRLLPDRSSLQLSEAQLFEPHEIFFEQTTVWNM